MIIDFYTKLINYKTLPVRLQTRNCLTSICVLFLTISSVRKFVSPRILPLKDTIVFLHIFFFPVFNFSGTVPRPFASMFDIFDAHVYTE